MRSSSATRSPRTGQQEETFKKLANNKLEPPYTWEVELSELGKRNFLNARERRKAFKKKWEELAGSGRLGYMATLKNLRNMLEVGISMRHVRRVADILRQGAKKILPQGCLKRRRRWRRRRIRWRW